MTSETPNSDDIDWSLTSWEGARRAQLRRWAALPLENVAAALEEMEAISTQLGNAGGASNNLPAAIGRVDGADELPPAA